MPPKRQISAPTNITPISTGRHRTFIDTLGALARWLHAREPPIADALSGRANKGDAPGAGLHTAHGRQSGQEKLLDDPVTVVCCSDTHNERPPNVPHGDILLHAGDLTNGGSFTELQAQLHWLQSLPHQHKVVIAGNHDILLDETFVTQHPERVAEEDIELRGALDWGSLVYLQNSSVSLDVRGRTVTVFGGPLTPQCGLFAFQYPPIRDAWKHRIPRGTDVVVSHGPPRGHLDAGGKGCASLLRELWRVRPGLVVFGHIHEGRGREGICWDAIQRGRDELGVLNVLRMAVAWAWWSLLYCICGRRRTARSLFVNAAVAGGGAAQVVQI